MLCQSNHTIQFFNIVVTIRTRKTILGNFVVLINNYYTSVPNKLCQLILNESSLIMFFSFKFISGNIIHTEKALQNLHIFILYF